MKVLMINVVCGIRSTGRICTDLATALEAEGHEVEIAYGRENVPEQFTKYAIKIGSDLDVKFSAIETRLFDNHGFANKKATSVFLEWASKYDPDLLWLHNIHGYYINVEMLFDWIKKRQNMKVRWTLHDCWPFTGHCAHFTIAKCSQWQNGCKHCKQLKKYPGCFLFGNVRKNYLRKKEVFSGVDDLTIITPSHWLADIVKKSFLKDYPIEIIHNTIDLNVFRPTPSRFREDNNLTNHKIILGVSSTWDYTKGYFDFIKLSEMLPENYRIVLVGLNEKQLKSLPANILGIRRTNNAKELAMIYTAADVFVNPTYQDNYPTVNLEARACGTPIITYDTGGSPESAGEDAVVIKCGDIDSLYRSILKY